MQPGAIADHDHLGVHTGAELDDGSAKQRIQPVRIDSGIGLGIHRSVLRELVDPRFAGLAKSQPW
jgi:hypothetical protein